MEMWKNINQFKKNRQTIKLEISDFGNVKKTNSKGWTKITTGSNNKDGYKIVAINKKKYRVHRLVLEHFVGECPKDKPECDHKDRNRSNNHIDNLKWCNRSENSLNRKSFKNKTGCINKTKSGTYQFKYYVNKKLYSKTFKTEFEAKIAQSFYKGAINIIEKY